MAVKNVAVSGGAVSNNVVASAPTAGNPPAGASPGTGGNTGTSAAGSTSLTANRGQRSVRSKLQALLSGLQSMLPAGSTLPTVGAVPLKVADLEAELAQVLGAYAAIDQQVTALKAARLALVPQETDAKALLAEVKQALVTFYGPTSPSLAHFGLPVKGAPRKLSAAKLLAAVTRSKGTRLIRNTMGSRQKAEKKFTGPVTVTAEAAPVAVAPAK